MAQSVSIIIPTYNNARTIENTIKALLNQEFDDQLEVIVVDDLSSDTTVDICKSLGIEVHSNPVNVGLAATLNLGIRLSKGTIIVTVHGDAEPLTSHWLTNLVTPISGANVGASCSIQFPPTLDKPRLTIWEKLLWGKVQPHQALNNKADAYNRSILERIGMFDELRFRTAGEDEDMGYRLRISGFKIVGSTGKIRHNHVFDSVSAESVFAGIIVKEFSFGRAGGAFRRKFPFHKPGSYVYPVPRSIFHDGIFRTVVCLGILIPYLQLLCIPALILLSLIGITSTARSTRLKLSLLLYPVFNITRFWSYAIGYLLGLVSGRQT